MKERAMMNACEDILLCLKSVPDDDGLLDELIGLVDSATLDFDYILSGRGLPELLPAPTKPPKVKLKFSISGALFYLVLIAVVVGFYVTTSATASGVPKSFAGYSVMSVLTKSMQREIPQGSLVITKVTDARSIQIGDDITYMRDARSTVTHRVVAIYESYGDSGERGFETQGIMNHNPDPDIVQARNVIGKVVYHNLAIGNAVKFVRGNVIYIGIFAALFLGFIAAVKIYTKNRRPTRHERSIPNENHP